MGLLDGRKDERFEFKEEVIIDEQVFTNCIDISKSGIFVHTVKPFKPKSIVKINIPAYDLELKAIVKHVKPRIGIGLEFRFQNEIEEYKVLGVIDNLKLSSEKTPKKFTILLVDSERQIRSIYKNRLLEDGFSVAEVEDGMDAIRKMNSFHVDAVIMELNVKRIELPQLISMIRDAPAYRAIPIFVIATPTGYDIEAWAMESGATKYLPRGSTKPADLANILHNYLAGEGGLHDNRGPAWDDIER